MRAVSAIYQHSSIARRSRHSAAVVRSWQACESGLYGGLFTPVEAGAVGAAGALVIALVKRRLDWHGLWKVLVETAHITAAICFLIISASLYSRMLAISGVTELLRGLIVDTGFGLARQCRRRQGVPIDRRRPRACCSFRRPDDASRPQRSITSSSSRARSMPSWTKTRRF